MNLIIDFDFSEDTAENCCMKSNIALSKTKYPKRLILEIEIEETFGSSFKYISASNLKLIMLLNIEGLN